ncbi:MAG: hypothetical protein JJU46_13405 [Balneolaceae bacterium]|nr:hypothetical protein [Balneolaceae bacterium]
MVGCLYPAVYNSVAGHPEWNERSECNEGSVWPGVMIKNVLNRSPYPLQILLSVRSAHSDQDDALALNQSRRFRSGGLQRSSYAGVES